MHGRTGPLWSTLSWVISASWANAEVPAPRDSNALGWYAYIGQHRFASDWDLHLEGQRRRSDVIAGWQQLLLRPAILYNVNRRWSVGAGYAYSRTYSYGAFPDPFATPEHRAFEQASTEHVAGEWTIGHRLRSEQRFQGLLPDPPTPRVERWRYQNRARYEFSACRRRSAACGGSTVPLRTSRLEVRLPHNSWFSSMWLRRVAPPTERHANRSRDSV